MTNNTQEERRDGKVKKRAFAPIMIAVILLGAVMAKSAASPPGLQTFTLPGGSLTTASLNAWGGVSGWVFPYEFNVDAVGIGSVGLRMYVYGLDMSKIYYEGGWTWPPDPKDLGAIADAGIAGDSTIQFDMKNAAWFQLHSTCGGGGGGGTWDDQARKYNHTTGARKWLVQGWSRGLTDGKVFPDDPTHQYNLERFVPNTQNWGDKYMPGYNLPHSEYQTFDFKIEYIPLGGGQYKMQGWIRMHAAASWDEMWYLNWPYKWQWNKAINNVADPENAWVRIGGHQSDGGERIVTNVDFSAVHPFVAIGNWGTTQANYHTISWSNVRIEGIPVAPSEVWVDDDWTGKTNGDLVEWWNDGSHIFGIDAFATISGGIGAVSAGGIAHVAPGTYNERLTIGKSLTLKGAQAGVDPTLMGARTNPAAESIVTQAGLPTTNPDVLIEITVSDVTIDGFSFVGEPNVNLYPMADRTVVRAWGDRTVIGNNIMDGARGVLVKDNNKDVTVFKNRMTVNKNGVVVQGGSSYLRILVLGNVILPGSMIAADPGGIYMTYCSGCKVVGNTATNFADPNPTATGGRGFAGSNLDHLTLSDNAFTGNKGAISIWGNSQSIEISNNDLSDTLGPKGYGIEIKGRDITITGNQITSNANTGIYVARHVIDTINVTISGNNIASNGRYGIYVDVNVDLPKFRVYCNSIAANTEYGVYNGAAGILDARYNWWGDPSGPYHAALNSAGLGDTVSDNVQFVPWKTVPEGIVVTIDIKPGTWPNSVNTKAEGVLPVAILSSVGFDATQLDPTTVTLLGAAPDKWSVKDINGDGKLDLMLHFRMQELNFAELGIGEHEVILTGRYLEFPFYGTDTIQIVK